MKKVLAGIGIMFICSSYLFALPSINVSGRYKDHGTNTNGTIWIGCWVDNTSTCFTWYPKNGNLTNPDQMTHVWVSNIQKGWTDIEAPIFTNGHDPVENEDFKNLNFSNGENTIEHSTYSSWENEVLNP